MPGDAPASRSPPGAELGHRRGRVRAFPQLKTPPCGSPAGKRRVSAAAAIGRRSWPAAGKRPQHRIDAPARPKAASVPGAGSGCSRRTARPMGRQATPRAAQPVLPPFSLGRPPTIPLRRRLRGTPALSAGASHGTLRAAGRRLVRPRLTRCSKGFTASHGTLNRAAESPPARGKVGGARRSAADGVPWDAGGRPALPSHGTAGAHGDTPTERPAGALCSRVQSGRPQVRRQAGFATAACRTSTAPCRSG